MANKRLIWDAVGERLFETGVDHGVLYVMGDNNTYGEGIAWNGLTAVNESPSGAESTALYADNIKYLNMISAEEYGYTIEAYYSPEEFDQCDGLASPVSYPKSEIFSPRITREANFTIGIPVTLLI